MTQIQDTDQYWKENWPEGYARYMAIYQQSIRGLKFWYIKHIRRYGYVKLFLLGNNSQIIKTLHFRLQDPKQKDGSVIINGETFSDLYSAWEYFQNLIFTVIVKEN